MADTALQVVVSPFIEVICGKLSSFIRSEIAQTSGVKKQMEKLSRTLSTVKDVINDAEEKQVTSAAIRNWLNELKDAAYDADDLLDECAFESLQLASQKRGNSYTNQVIGSAKQINFRCKIGKRIKELRECFDEIAERRSKFHLQMGSLQRGVERYQDRETSSILTEPEVFGRAEDKEHLVTLLLNNVNGQEGISICPILGIGGIGKTTLAQLIYNDNRVAEHFEVKSWVYVSEDFDVKQLIRTIIVSISGNACDLQELDPLQRLLREELHGKRFLIVFDDVWNENQDPWNKLKTSLGYGEKGSSVVVTTRLETVAFITGTISAYRLNALSEDDCWSLFKRRAFGLGNEERPALLKIGREIVKKCGGVPLAAKALGGLMRFKNDENEWLFVRDSQIWDLPQSNENSILPALKLSYNHLPSHMKQCFSYCSIFRKDFNIEKEELILLWIANGLVLPEENMELEDVGDEIFKEFVSRSFFQEIWKDEDGNIKCCKIHDLVHDLACHIADAECSAMDIERPKTITRRTRHLSLLSSTQGPSSMLEYIPKFSPCLRSIIALNFKLSIENVDFIFSRLIRLRALGLNGTSVTEIPSSIGKLKHLRYLNLSHAKITSLPESICGLRNLQTLKLEYCNRLQLLPKDMGKMCSLRHLDIRKCFSLTKIPIEMGKLAALQTLSVFIVGCESGRGIGELQGMNLRGELEIKGLEYVKSSTEIEEANLIRKKNLSSLQLSWSHSNLQDHEFEVIKGLQPHSNLRRLGIKGYQGMRFPSWLAVSSLPNLVKISLENCTRCEHLPPLGRLPILKFLSIYRMDSLKFLDEEGYGESVVKGFPSLEKLEMSFMYNLEGWTSCQGGGAALFPLLKRLTLKYCPRLIEVPLFPALESLTLEGCSKLTAVPLFPSLEILSLSLMDNLEGWTLSQVCEGIISPCLRKLTAKSCPRLAALPLFPFLERMTLGECHNLKAVHLSASLQSVEVSKCNKMNLGALQNLPRLWYLSIGEFDEFEYFPEGMLQNITALKTLEIYKCRELISLPEGLRSLSSLQKLTILDCHCLKYLPELEMRSLEDLSISDCESLTSPPGGLRHMSALQKLYIRRCPEFEVSTQDFQYLIHLRRLRLGGLPKFTYLPEGIKHARMLEYLLIEEPDLIELPEWIGNLTSLLEMLLAGCKNLKALPEGMQHLTALESLMIRGCHPELKKRCEKGKGQDWHKISHIPHIEIISGR